MTKYKTTPTPWQVDKRDNFIMSGDTVIAEVYDTENYVKQQFNIVSYEEAKNNSHLIVKCVNEYETLLAASKTLILAEKRLDEKQAIIFELVKALEAIVINSPYGVALGDIERGKAVLKKAEAI